MYAITPLFASVGQFMQIKFYTLPGVRLYSNYAYCKLGDNAISWYHQADLMMGPVYCRLVMKCAEMVEFWLICFISTY